MSEVVPPSTAHTSPHKHTITNTNTNSTQHSHEDRHRHKFSGLSPEARCTLICASGTGDQRRSAGHLRPRRSGSLGFLSPRPAPQNNSDGCCSGQNREERRCFREERRCFSRGQPGSKDTRRTRRGDHQERHGLIISAASAAGLRCPPPASATPVGSAHLALVLAQALLPDSPRRLAGRAVTIG